MSWPWKKDVKLLNNYAFSYKVRIQGKQGLTDSPEFEARVKAESIDEAKEILTKEVLSNFKMKIIITHPVEEQR